MLELRPGCEHCNRALPPAATDAMICSYECTFCRDCVDHLLENVCPNCGGGFEPRPIQPRLDRQGGNFLGADPACTAVKHRPVDLARHRVLIDALRGIPPHAR